MHHAVDHHDKSIVTADLVTESESIEIKAIDLAQLLSVLIHPRNEV